MYVGYQAPAKNSDDLSPQFAVIHKALDSAKIKHFSVSGYEADDLIALSQKKLKPKICRPLLFRRPRLIATG